MKIIKPKSLKYRLVVLFMLFFVSITCYAFSGFFSSPVWRSAPFSGVVVDAETKEPLSGVVVVMSWPLITSQSGGTAGNIEAIERITDAQGRYQINGWEKIKKEVGKGIFKDYDPEVNFLKAGYWPAYRSNRVESQKTFKWGEVWEAEWDGEVIEMKPVHPENMGAKDWKRYLRYVSTFQHGAIGECSWVALPNDYRERDRIVRRAYYMAYRNDRGITLDLQLSGVFAGGYAEGPCSLEAAGDPVQFFLEHGMSMEEIKATYEPRTSAWRP